MQIEKKFYTSTCSQIYRLSYVVWKFLYVFFQSAVKKWYNKIAVQSG